MSRRVLIATFTLSAVGLALGSAAVAQAQRGRLVEMRQQLTQSRARTPADPNPTKIAAPGDYRFSFVSDGITREYLLHVPKSYRPGIPAPLLMALHGGGGNADFQARDSNYGLISASERYGFVAVFPNGYSRFGNGMLATWNAGSCCGAAQRNGVDDVAFLREVIRRVDAQAGIDAAKVFVTGMSNGAMMSWRLACEAPEVRGIAPVEGTDNTASCKPAHPVPVIEFHAADDPNVPFNGGVGSGPSQTDFVSVPATQAKWTRIDGAQPDAVRVLTVPGAHCDLHKGPAPVELCVTDGGGHSWPGGGTKNGRKAPSAAISADDLMWAFFSSL
jgi:polyhydroxybutyrate depolymerase